MVEFTLSQHLTQCLVHTGLNRCRQHQLSMAGTVYSNGGQGVSCGSRLHATDLNRPRKGLQTIQTCLLILPTSPQTRPDPLAKGVVVDLVFSIKWALSPAFARMTLKTNKQSLPIKTGLRLRGTLLNHLMPS